jgi:hypothetical protein
MNRREVILLGFASSVALPLVAWLDVHGPYVPSAMRTVTWIVSGGVLVLFWVKMLLDHLEYGRRGFATLLMVSFNILAAVIYFWFVYLARPRDVALRHGDSSRVERR